MGDGRIHVCHVQTTLRAGGLENGVVNVVNGLDPARFRSTVVCLHDAGALAERITNPAAAVINLAYPDRLAPELPTREPAMISMLLLSEKPMPAAAQPE